MDGSIATTPKDGALSTSNEAPGDNTELAELLTQMTQQMRIYTQSRIAGLRKVESARAAGYAHPDVDCSRLEKTPIVKQAILLGTQTFVRGALIDRQDVLSGLMDAVTSAGSSTELTQAWREIGRIIGAYEPEKVEINVKIEDLTQQRLQEMPMKDLIELAKKGDVYTAEDDPNASEFEALGSALAEPEPIEYAEVVDAEEG